MACSGGGGLKFSFSSYTTALITIDELKLQQLKWGIFSPFLPSSTRMITGCRKTLHAAIMQISEKRCRRQTYRHKGVANYSVGILLMVSTLHSCLVFLCMESCIDIVFVAHLVISSLASHHTPLKTILETSVNSSDACRLFKNHLALNANSRYWLQPVSTANGETLDDLHFVFIEFLSPHRRGPPCQIAHLLQLSPPPLQMGKLEKYTRVICPAIVNLFSFPCSNCLQGMTWPIF